MARKPKSEKVDSEENNQEVKQETPVLKEENKRLAMKSLDDHNKERMNAHLSKELDTKPVRNGILCPKCNEKELFDTAPHIILTSNPPQKLIGCECGYKGYRLA